jgi:hypothetical protein
MNPITTSADTGQNFKNLSQEFRGNSSEPTNSAKGDLRHASAKVEGKVLGFIGSASNKISHATDTVTKEIRSNPVQASLVALGAGYILGALFRR